MIRPTALAALAVLTACLSPADAVTIRQFDPLPPVPTRPDPGQQPPRLDIAPPTAALHLDRPMTWRTSTVEIVHDERNRWVATPDALVGASLRDAVAGRGILPPDSTGGAPRVHTHVAAFEAVRSAGGLEAVVILDLELTVSAAPRATHRAMAREAVAGDSAEAIATATRTALGRALADAVGWLDERLRAR